MKTKPQSSTRRKPAAEPKYSRTQVPHDMDPVAWQRALRRQFGRAQRFGWANLGSERFFSDFAVSNPDTRARYRVAIRGTQPGDNFCTCLDYATNELGTCKHIEYTLARLEQERGAKTALARGYHPTFSELYLRNSQGRALHLRLGTDCPPALRESAARVFDAKLGWRLPPQRLARLDALVAAFAKAGHELRFYDDARQFVAGLRDARQRESALDRHYPQGPEDPGLRDLLKVPLYPYQLQGALFAVRAGRALIGDEMGLGKTIQAIAAVEILARHFGVGKVLVVCPTSLKYQWQSEISRFSGRESLVMSGGRPQRQRDYAHEDFCKITNYEKLHLDLDLITRWAPDIVIVDEAQRVKNWNTVAARALKRIDSPYALVLTGTPLQNKLEELISIVQFVDQHRLGPTWKLLYEHQVRDEIGRVIGYTGLDRVGQTLAPILIRRRKSEVLLQLPARTDQNLMVPMTEPQAQLHAENYEIVTRIVARWCKYHFLSDTDQRRLNAALQNMRMACNSTYLLDQETDHGVKADELAAFFDELFAQPDTKAVVFSQWTRTQDILVRRLQARGIGHVCFHGGVPAEKRPALVERFRDDPQCRVFLASDAGAAGLNLQFASTLINMDLPWNPALLEQRIGRVHRMGQKHPVHIINLISKGTIEEGMLSKLAFKRALAAGILDGSQSEISLGGSRLTNFMKDVENITAQMGAADPVTPAEEWDSVQAAADAPELPLEPESPLGTPDEAGVGAAVEALPHDTAPEADRTLQSVQETPAPRAHGGGLADRVDGARHDAADGGVACAGEAPTGRSAGLPGSGDAGADPWESLALVGTQLLTALASARDPAAPAHPWVERHPQTGTPHLKLPLPSPEATHRIADALMSLADALRRR